MLRSLSRGEIESMLAGQKPGVNNEIVRYILRFIHGYKFRPTALMVIQGMEDLKFYNSETCRMLRKGVELATVKA